MICNEASSPARLSLLLSIAIQQPLGGRWDGIKNEWKNFHFVAENRKRFRNKKKTFSRRQFCKICDLFRWLRVAHGGLLVGGQAKVLADVARVRTTWKKRKKKLSKWKKLKRECEVKSMAVAVNEHNFQGDGSQFGNLLSGKVDQTFGGNMTWVCRWRDFFFFKFFYQKSLRMFGMAKILQLRLRLALVRVRKDKDSPFETVIKADISYQGIH